MHRPSDSSVSIPATLIHVSLVALLFTGCASDPPAADLRLSSENYNDVFDQTLEVIRRAGYQLERVDRRKGVITTRPLDAGSVLEPWRDPHTTPAQAIESTFNYERRKLRITFIPASGMPEIGWDNQTSDGLPVATAQVARPTEPRLEISNVQGTLRVDVQCVIERSHRPGRRIETASTRKVSYTIDPSLAERGIPAQYWEPVSRDPHTEQYFMNLIARSAPGMVQLEQYTPAAQDPGS